MAVHDWIERSADWLQCRPIPRQAEQHDSPTPPRIQTGRGLIGTQRVCGKLCVKLCLPGTGAGVTAVAVSDAVVAVMVRLRRQTGSPESRYL